MSLQQACLEQYLRRVQLLQRSHSIIILHYDPAARDLRPWLWPVISGIRVTPTGLCRYRNDHQFRAPCCLCACDAATYVESAIYVSLGGLYHGEYVAGCAKGRCGYLICLERMYTRKGLLLQTFPLRVAGAPCLPPVLYSPTHDNNVVPSALLAAKGFKRVTGSPSILLTPVALMIEQPAKAPAATLELLMRLDSSSGLSSSEFRKLFAKCLCGLVMTSRVFKDHVCQVATAAAAQVRARPNVINLALEDSDESSEESLPRPW